MPIVSWRVERERELELGADAVGARDEHRLAIALRQLDERAEAADAGEHLGAQRALRERLDALDERVAGVDVDAGVAIRKRDARGRERERAHRNGDAAAKRQIRRAVEGTVERRASAAVKCGDPADFTGIAESGPVRLRLAAPRRAPRRFPWNNSSSISHRPSRRRSRISFRGATPRCCRRWRDSRQARRRDRRPRCGVRRAPGSRICCARAVAAASARGATAAYFADPGTLVGDGRRARSVRTRSLRSTASIPPAPTRRRACSRLFNAAPGAKADICSRRSRAPPASLALREDLRTPPGLGPRLRDRTPLADEDKAAALGAYARRRGFALPDDVIRYLLAHGRRDMPALVGALAALDRHSLAVRASDHGADDARLASAATSGCAEPPDRIVRGRVL